MASFSVWWYQDPLTAAAQRPVVPRPQISGFRPTAHFCWPGVECRSSEELPFPQVIVRLSFFYLFAILFLLL